MVNGPSLPTPQRLHLRPSAQSIELPRRPSSARYARKFVHRVLQQLGAGAVADVAVLLASELVTNAVLHGEGGVTVTVVPGEGRVVRIRVSDEDDAPPQPREASTDDTSGRGLRLVEILASRWGSDPATPDRGKVVWFELRY